jgi:CheY-like chemotaxis protein
VCDTGVPDVDGYETCRLRRLPGLEKAVIAAVSGYGGPEDGRKSKEAGFDQHLMKPICRAATVELVKSDAGSCFRPPLSPYLPAGALYGTSSAARVVRPADTAWPLVTSGHISGCWPWISPPPPRQRYLV